MTLVYLASPIDQAGVNVNGGVRLTEQRLYALEALTNAGVAAFNPAVRPYGSAAADPVACRDINEYALGRADGVLAILPSGVASVGVPMEIQNAWQRGKPVVVVSAVGSMQLAGMDVPVYESPVLAVRRLMEEIEKPRPSTSVIDLRYRSLTELKWTGDVECCPVQGYEGDAGFDLVVAQDARIAPSAFVDVDCGVRVELPPGVWAMITGRSSTLRKRGLLVHQGIIDNGYRGPLYAGVWNLGENKALVTRGERIAQLIPFPQTSAGMALTAVAELSGSDRGDRGFGSTGA